MAESPVSKSTKSFIRAWSAFPALGMGIYRVYRRELCVGILTKTKIPMTVRSVGIATAKVGFTTAARIAVAVSIKTKSRKPAQNVTEGGCSDEEAIYRGWRVRGV
jgi:hypothetical protein